MSDDLELTGARVAILAADRFAAAELFVPREALLRAGAEVVLVSIGGAGLEENHRSSSAVRHVEVDYTVDEVGAQDFDALLVPGGLYSADTLRRSDAACEFVRGFFKLARVVGTLCYGPQILISAHLVEGRTLTASPSIHIDLANAGAHVLDEAVVVDAQLVSSRGPEDLDAFCAQFLACIAEHRRDPGGAAGSGARRWTAL